MHWKKICSSCWAIFRLYTPGGFSLFPQIAKAQQNGKARREKKYAKKYGSAFIHIFCPLFFILIFTSIFIISPNNSSQKHIRMAQQNVKEKWIVKKGFSHEYFLFSLLYSFLNLFFLCTTNHKSTTERRREERKPRSLSSSLISQDLSLGMFLFFVLCFNS